MPGLSISSLPTVCRFHEVSTGRHVFEFCPFVPEYDPVRRIIVFAVLVAAQRIESGAIEFSGVMNQQRIAGDSRDTLPNARIARRHAPESTLIKRPRKQSGAARMRQLQLSADVAEIGKQRRKVIEIHIKIAIEVAIGGGGVRRLPEMREKNGKVLKRCGAIAVNVADDSNNR